MNNHYRIASDPLFPVAAALPLSEPGGVVTPMPNIPGNLRPFSASLGVAPIECGKHDTASTRDTVLKATETSKDGVVVPDSVKVVATDT